VVTSLATDAAFIETLDTLVPDAQVHKEFGVTSIWRWDRDPELMKLGPITIRSRRLRSRIALENFKPVMIRRAIERRARP
jgi:hypothetical protein